MYVFIATIFIAELIIAGSIILLLKKLDTKVKSLNEDSISCGKELIKTTKEVKEILISAQNIMDNAVSYVNRKKKEFRQKLINLAAIYAILVIFKVKFRRAALILQYLILAKDIWSRIPV